MDPCSIMYLCTPQKPNSLKSSAWARRHQPHLSSFQNDWATAELVKQYLSNRRESDSRKRRLLSEGPEQAKKHRRADKATSGDEDINEGADADDEREHNDRNEGSGEGSERESEG